MENRSEQKEDLLSSDYLKVDEWSGSNLKSAAVWAKTIAIIAAVISIIFFGLFAFLGNKFYSVVYLLGQSSGIVLIVIGLIVLAVILLLVVVLFRFSSGTTNGVETQDAIAFEKGIDNLKIFFVASGVIAVLYVLLAIINFFTTL